jgi:hypothetical protein
VDGKPRESNFWQGLVEIKNYYGNVVKSKLELGKGLAFGRIIDSFVKKFPGLF